MTTVSTPDRVELAEATRVDIDARSVRNAIDRIKLRQANRLIGHGGSVPKEELVRIDAADIRQSRVFSGRLDAEPENRGRKGGGT